MTTLHAWETILSASTVRCSIKLSLLFVKSRMIHAARITSLQQQQHPWTEWSPDTAAVNQSVPSSRRCPFCHESIYSSCSSELKESLGPSGPVTNSFSLWLVYTTARQWVNAVLSASFSSSCVAHTHRPTRFHIYVEDLLTVCLSLSTTFVS